MTKIYITLFNDRIIMHHWQLIGQYLVMFILFLKYRLVTFSLQEFIVSLNYGLVLVNIFHTIEDYQCNNRNHIIHVDSPVQS